METISCENDMLSLINFYNPSDKIIMFLFFAVWDNNSMKVYQSIESILCEKFESVCAAGINTDVLKKLAKKYKVTSIPTIIFYRGEKEIFRNIGYISTDSLSARIDSLILTKSDYIENTDTASYELLEDYLSGKITEKEYNRLKITKTNNTFAY